MRRETEEFRQVIERCNRFVLTTHVNPDPDAIGSELALARFLGNHGKIVAVLNHSPMPKYCEFLDTKNIVEQFSPGQHANLILNADSIIVLDANQPDRLQSLKPYILQSKAFKVCIDHHLDRMPFADLYIIDEESAATGEILFNLLLALDDQSLTQEIAAPLYAAIMTDTGSFRFPKTDTELHRIIADLIERGADPVETYRRIYEQGTANRLQLLGHVLTTLQLAHRGKVASMVVTREMFSRTETTEEDIETFINYAMTIGGVQVGLLFTELPDGVKISFRSRGEIPVNKLAQEFGGNGHKNAAGARIAGATLDSIFKNVIERSQYYLA
jgi:phosphoesterase RecJ-like protein